MKVIVGDRGRGKTWRAAEWFCENPTERIVIVSHYRMRSDFIRYVEDWRPDLAATSRAWVGNIKTLDTMKGLRGQTVREVLIDNLDLILRDFIGYGPVDIVATSTEPWDVVQL